MSCLTAGRENNLKNCRGIVEEMQKVQKILFHNNELQILEELESRAQIEKTHIFLCSTLHSFVDHIDGSLFPSDFAQFDNYPVIVDLMNIFDGTLKLVEESPISSSDCILECFKRLLLFFQVSLGVQELKKGQVVHKDIKVENILINKKLGWACISDFGVAIRYGDDNLPLPNQRDVHICGARIKPPEINSMTQGNITRVDKIDVFLLGSILESIFILPLQSLEYNIESEHLRKNVVAAFVELKSKIEKENYEDRMGIEDLNSILEYFIIFMLHVIEKDKFFIQVVAVWKGMPFPSDPPFKNYIFQLLPQGSSFSIQEKLIIEILVKMDLARTQHIIALTQTHLKEFFEFPLLTSLGYLNLKLSKIIK